MGLVGKSVPTNRSQSWDRRKLKVLNPTKT